MNGQLADIARHRHRTRVVRVATAFGALAVGALLYALVRPQAAAFLPAGWHHPVLASTGLPLATALIGAAPAFLHALAMSLLIVVATGAVTPRGRGRCCVAVCVVEIAFEVAQHPLVVAALLASASASSAAGGIDGAFRSYLRHGTFDLLDLAAACAGCLVAVTLIARATPDRLTSLGARHATA